MDLSNYTIYTILSYLSISPTSSDLPSFTLLSTSSNGTVQSYLQTVLMILLHTSEEEITKVGFMPKMGVGVEGAGKEVLRGVYDEIYKVRRIITEGRKECGITVFQNEDERVLASYFNLF